MGQCVRVQVDAVEEGLVGLRIDDYGARHRIGAVVIDSGVAWRRARGTVDELQCLAVLRIVEIDDAAFREAALRCFQRFLFVMAGRHEDAVAVFVDVAKALADGNRVAGATFFFRTRVLGIDFQRRCAFFQDEVDHAGDGVRAIECRGAVRQHFHALDGRQGDRVQVDGGARIGWGNTTAVQQHQRVGCADIVDRGRGDAAAAAAHRIGGHGEALHRRNLLDEIGHGGDAGFLDVFLVERLYGQRRFGSDALDARTGDFHALHGAICCFLCIRGVHAQGHAACKHQAQRPRYYIFYHHLKFLVIVIKAAIILK
ncbi:hypothetical protein D3C81_926750 [compost metagenome]